MRGPANGGASANRLRATALLLRERLSRLSIRTRIALAIVLALNVIFAGLYLWSRGGETITIRVEARGDQFSAYVDGKLHASATFAAPAAGGIVVSVVEDQRFPSLPGPAGIDRATVTDLETGQVLFEDEFSDGPKPDWHVLGQLAAEDGVLTVDGTGTLSLTSRGWQDYALEVSFRNVTAGAVMVRALDEANGVRYGFRPFRHYDNGLTMLTDGQVVSDQIGPLLEANRTQTLKSITAMVLRPYPLALLVVAAGVVIVALAEVAAPLFRGAGRLRAPPWLPWAAVGLLSGGAFFVTLYLNYSLNSHMPHVPDEVAYIFQAKLLASLRLTAPLPPAEVVFDYFYPPFIVQSDGRWAGVYTVGHPLAMALGMLVHAPWLVPPLLGAATVVLTFAVGRRLYGAGTGFVAALLLASSPFFLMTASNFMSHNTAAFYLVASLFFLVIAERRPRLYGVLGGLFFGLLFNTRQLDAVSLVPAFSLLLLSGLRDPGRRRAAAETVGGFLAGGVLMLAVFLLYNLGTSGDALQTTMQAGTEIEESVGFRGAHSVSLGIQNEQAQLAALLMVLNGWPQYVGLVFVLFPFILGTRHRWDWALLCVALSVIGVHVLFIGHGIMHGPRYWYPATPFLMLLTARGAECLAAFVGDAVGRLRSALGRTEFRHAASAHVLAYAVIAALVGAGVYGWLLGRHTTWQVDTIPNRAVALEGFNGVDDRLVRLTDEADLEHALVLVQQCSSWQCYGSVFWLNTPDLDGNVVFANDVPEYRGALLSAYPDRRVYSASYVDMYLVPYGSTPNAEGRAPGTPPLASDITVPTPTQTPVPTPDEAGIAARDEQRVLGLRQAADALGEYRRKHGTYPLAPGLQSLCRYREADVGCRLLEVLDPLPQDPDPERTYWYQSDGASFLLIAELDRSAEGSACPDVLPPPATSAAHPYCVTEGP